jgi:hypothetical protein
MSRSSRSAISNAPSTISRCWRVKPGRVTTRSRSSPSVSSWRATAGSPPRRRTTRSVVVPSSHTAGRASVASSASGRATSLPQASARCSATRLGTSSPNTRVTKVSTAVTDTIASGSAHRPRKLSRSTSRSAMVTAAVAEARKSARVMPNWTVARKRLGSRASRASTAPRPPRLLEAAKARAVVRLRPYPSGLPRSRSTIAPSAEFESCPIRGTISALQATSSKPSSVKSSSNANARRIPWPRINSTLTLSTNDVPRRRAARYAEVATR